VTNNRQQADTGTKMIHIGKNTRSTIISKGISAGKARTPIAAWCVHRRRENARNFTQCDSLLIGDKCGAHTVPLYRNPQRRRAVEHEATTSKIGEDQLFYCACSAASTRKKRSR
jgi:Fe-S cluster assembly protein SufB